MKVSSFNLFSFWVCLLTFTLFTGCSKDEEERIVIMDVSPELVWSGTVPESGSQVQVMECKIEGGNEKYYLSQGKIEGFEYEEGYLYRLRVRITPIKNPPADGNIERFELLELISKEKVDPEQ